MGRCTITGMLTASGNQFKDWSAAYRIFKGQRMNIGAIFSEIRKDVLRQNRSKSEYIYAHMDDTLLRKRGKKIFGTGWLRDPLGPPFCNNFIWGQRFVQLSVSLIEKDIFGPSRAIPVDFKHCPPTRKPSKNATDAELALYRERQKKEKMSEVGVQRVIALRKSLDDDGYKNKQLILSVDGSYTNGTVLRKLPENVDLIGRIRKDSKIYSLPEEQQSGKGRKRYYGEELPTPEEIRQSADYPYLPVEAWAAGKLRTFNVKVVKGIRWRKSGKRNLMLLIIRPVCYRLTKKSKLLYRAPAYLISTNQDIDIALQVQAYIRRWEIEVGFRDQKTLMGCGQAQIREKSAVEKVPAFVSACYGMMLLASHKVQSKRPTQLPGPKWYVNLKKQRTTTGDIINRYRVENWAQSVKINFSDFVNIEKKLSKCGKLANPAFSFFILCQKLAKLESLDK
nr:transposase [Arachidicoccus soli]